MCTLSPCDWPSFFRHPQITSFTAFPMKPCTWSRDYRDVTDLWLWVWVSCHNSEVGRPRHWFCCHGHNKIAWNTLIKDIFIREFIFSIGGWMNFINRFISICCSIFIRFNTHRAQSFCSNFPDSYLFVVNLFIRLTTSKCIYLI
jgi:hypothetical protein